MLARAPASQLKVSTTIDLCVSVFLIFVQCVALRNLDLLIKTGWSVRAVLTGPLFPIGIEHLIYMKFFCYGSS